jgi:hypothetical protein
MPEYIVTANGFTWGRMQVSLTADFRGYTTITVHKAGERPWHPGSVEIAVSPEGNVIRAYRIGKGGQRIEDKELTL